MDNEQLQREVLLANLKDKHKTNHILHLLLSILTLGLWVPVWVFVAINNLAERKKIDLRAGSEMAPELQEHISGRVSNEGPNEKSKPHAESGEPLKSVEHGSSSMLPVILGSIIGALLLVLGSGLVFFGSLIIVLSKSYFFGAVLILIGGFLLVRLRDYFNKNYKLFLHLSRSHVLFWIAALAIMPLVGHFMNRDRPAGGISQGVDKASALENKASALEKINELLAKEDYRGVVDEAGKYINDPQIFEIHLSASKKLLAEIEIPRSDKGDKGRYVLLEKKSANGLTTTIHRRDGSLGRNFTRSEIDCKRKKMRVTGEALDDLKNMNDVATPWFELIEGSSKSDLFDFICKK